MRERSNTCCFSGHRDISLTTYDVLVRRMEPLIECLVENGYKYFACGGALGFDTFAATFIVSLKRRGMDIKLVLILPCKDQTAKWGEYNKSVYNRLLEYADEIIYTADSYYTGCMQKRNRALIDASSVCICYLLSDRPSGTLQTVEYAKTQGVALVNVAEN